MKLADIRDLLRAEVISGGDRLDIEIRSCCGADLMSDVLAFTKEQTMLLTGLTSPQVVRTAEMSDLVAIVFVRGKRPGQPVIELAGEVGIPLLATEYPLFEACGIIYQHGIRGTAPREGWQRAENE
ncbi:MAG: DRTGG domain-containing protein [Negativicutes bacterium]|nr:DRTGG domain-containing protein [Negativicutes bacterium]